MWRYALTRDMVLVVAGVKLDTSYYQHRASSQSIPPHIVLL